MYPVGKLLYIFITQHLIKQSEYLLNNDLVIQFFKENSLKKIFMLFPMLFFK